MIIVTGHLFLSRLSMSSLTLWGSITLVHINGFLILSRGSSIITRALFPPHSDPFVDAPPALQTILEIIITWIWCVMIYIVLGDYGTKKKKIPLGFSPILYSVRIVDHEIYWQLQIIWLEWNLEWLHLTIWIIWKINVFGL